MKCEGKSVGLWRFTEKYDYIPYFHLQNCSVLNGEYTWALWSYSSAFQFTSLRANEITEADFMPTFNVEGHALEQRRSRRTRMHRTLMTNLLHEENQQRLVKTDCIGLQKNKTSTFCRRQDGHHFTWDSNTERYTYKNISAL